MIPSASPVSSSFSSTFLSSSEDHIRLAAQEAHDLSKAILTVTNSADPRRVRLLTSRLALVTAVLIVDSPMSLLLPVLSVSLFPSIQELYIDTIPPSTLRDLFSLRIQLKKLEMVNSGITSLQSVFLPIDRKHYESLSPYVSSVDNAVNNAACAISSSSSSSTVADTTTRASDSSSSVAINNADSSSSSTSDVHNINTISSSSSHSSSHRNDQVCNDPPATSISSPLSTPTDVTFKLPTDRYQWRKLRSLRLSNCGIATLDASFHYMPALEYLDVSHNDISSLRHLQNCSSLSTIIASHNKITSTKKLERVLGNVTTLILANNQIESIEGLAKVFSLQVLDVSFNRIDSVAEVQHLRNLPCLASIHFIGNPLSRHMNYRLMVSQHLSRCHDTTVVLPTLDGRVLVDHNSCVLREGSFLGLECPWSVFDPISHDTAHGVLVSDQMSGETDPVLDRITHIRSRERKLAHRIVDIAGCLKTLEQRFPSPSKVRVAREAYLRRFPLMKQKPQVDFHDEEEEKESVHNTQCTNSGSSSSGSSSSASGSNSKAYSCNKKIFDDIERLIAAMERKTIGDGGFVSRKSACKRSFIEENDDKDVEEGDKEEKEKARKDAEQVVMIHSEEKSEEQHVEDKIAQEAAVMKTITFRAAEPDDFIAVSSVDEEVVEGTLPP